MAIVCRPFFFLFIFIKQQILHCVTFLGRFVLKIFETFFRVGFLFQATKANQKFKYSHQIIVTIARKHHGEKEPRETLFKRFVCEFYTLFLVSFSTVHQIKFSSARLLPQPSKSYLPTIRNKYREMRQNCSTIDPHFLGNHSI